MAGVVSENRRFIHWGPVTIERDHDVIELSRCTESCLEDQHIRRHWHEDGAVVERIRILSTQSAAIRSECWVKHVRLIWELNLSGRIRMEVNDDRDLLIAMRRAVRDRGQEDLKIKRAILIRIDHYFLVRTIELWHCGVAESFDAEGIHGRFRRGAIDSEVAGHTHTNLMTFGSVEEPATLYCNSNGLTKLKMSNPAP